MSIEDLPPSIAYYAPVKRESNVPRPDQAQRNRRAVYRLKQALACYEKPKAAAL